MIVYDEAKRLVNLEKHGIDLVDASLVYDSPNKITLESKRKDENRKLDIAWVEEAGVVLVLVYVERGANIRAISLRRASRPERRLYETEKQD